MKTLLEILRLPPEAEERYKTAHHIWMALALTGSNKVGISISHNNP